MKNEQILKKAIEKAVKGGYEFPFDMVKSAMGEAIYGDRTWVPRVIFSHDFAKAFWGIQPLIWGCYSCGSEATADDNKWHKRCDCQSWARLGVRPWKWHLQQMVLEKEPLKYLERFIK